MLEYAEMCLLCRKVTETALLAVFLTLLLFTPALLVKGKPLRLTRREAKDTAAQHAWTSLYVERR